MSGNGPLSKDDIYAVWKASVDRSYSEPYEEAGEGNGLEVHTQAAHQLARISQAADTTTQALYLQPYSGQTDMPAQGEAKATVMITLARAGSAERLVTLKAGQFTVEEYQEDWGENGPEMVRTGRRYIIAEDVTFAPMEVGPVQVLAVAERAGWGYNNPLPGKISWITQVGTNLNNSQATLAKITNPPTASWVGLIPPTYSGTPALVKLTCKAAPDMFTPDSIGQYVLFTTGANAGKYALITDYLSPVDGAEFYVGGSSAVLKQTVVIQGDPALGTGVLLQGEYAYVNAGGQNAIGYVENVRMSVTDVATIELSYVQGPIAVFSASNMHVIGATSSANAYANFILVDGILVDEAPVSGVGGATWRIMDWVVDLGLSCSNEKKPAGGRLGFLDMLGAERGVYRNEGESDTLFRKRILGVSDVVTPDAINRAIVRAIGQAKYCLHEPGDADFPGAFFDDDFYDYDIDEFEVPFAQAAAVAAFESSIPTKLSRVELIDNLTGFTTATGWYGGSRTRFSSLFIYLNLDGNPTFEYVPGRTFTIVCKNKEDAPANLTITGSIYQTVNPFVTEEVKTKYMLNQEQYRGFMFICMPHSNLGEFGEFYDDGFYDAGDANFYDGFPAVDAAIGLRLAAALDATKAGGVGYELCMDDDCA